jgi:DNA-binding NarL/FixJ family response regulator
LLADDNLNLRQLLKGLTEAHAGWHVCGETDDGLEAVGKAIELDPDVVVVDFAMPRLNGLQVAAKVLSVRPTLPIILHTVHFFPAMVDEAKRIGIREVVSKSETAGRLMDVIETLLKENPSDPASAPSILPQPERSDAEVRDDEQKPPEPN